MSALGCLNELQHTNSSGAARCLRGTPGRGANLAAAPAVLPQRPPGRDVPLCHRCRALVTGSRVPGSCRGASGTGASCCHQARWVLKAWGRWRVPPGSAAISMAWWQAPGDSGAPQKKAGEHQPCCSNLTAGRHSRSAEQKAIAVFFQCFESSVGLPGEGDGKRSQVSSREPGGVVGAPAGHSTAALLPAPEEKAPGAL